MAWAQASFVFADDAKMLVPVQLEPGLRVLADAVDLARVLPNLLENARRYGRSPDGISHVQVRASATQAWVLLTITDHGSGVAPEQLRQLTRPYYRVASDQGGSGQQESGSGLGLAIVETSVLRMGGGFSLSLADHGGLCANMRLRRG